MKRFGYLAILLAIMTFTSCDSLNKMKDGAEDVTYVVTPSVLEVHGGKVDFSVKVTYPESYFNKKAVLTLTPVLKYADGEQAIDPIAFQGELVEENNKVVKYAGGTQTVSGSFDFVEGMRLSELMVNIQASAKGKVVDIPAKKLADGVIAISTLNCNKAKPVVAADKFQRVIPETKVADIHYQINSPFVRNSELRDADVKDLATYVKDVNSKEDYVFKGFNISSYASPDGEFDLNEKLADKRVASAERYWSKSLKRAKVEFEEFAKNATPEDWDGFKTLMQASDIADKEIILRVLSKYSDPVVRESEIKNISNVYVEIAKDILPQLRRSKLIVNVDVVGYSDEEIKALIDSNPSELDVEEMLYAATLFPEDFAKQIEIYKAATKAFPSCFRAHNNLGYAYMKAGKEAAAVAALGVSKGLKASDEVATNLGFIALQNAKYAEAKTFFASVATPTKESKHGLGTVAITEGNYQEAVNYFGTNASYNAALAQYLNGDTAAATSTLGKCKGAKATYLLAVIAADKGDEAAVLANLRKACEANSELKATAKTEASFAKYFANSTFTSIVE